MQLWVPWVALKPLEPSHDVIGPLRVLVKPRVEVLDRNQFYGYRDFRSAHLTNPTGRVGSVCDSSTFAGEEADGSVEPGQEFGILTERLYFCTAPLRGVCQIDIARHLRI